MSRRKKIVDPVMVSLDFGGSGLKCLFCHGFTECEVLYMEPEVISATLESLKEKTAGHLNNAYPENLAWVGIGDDYRAVGYLAASRYHGNAGLSQKKYSMAVYRTIAALWVVQQRLKLSDSFEMSLGILLPPGEFEDSQLLLRMLKEALTSFETPTGSLSVKLTKFLCYPEGAGVYFLHCAAVGELIKSQVIAVVMVGYRNASVLVSHRGVVDKGKTTDLGMVRLVESVQEKTSGLKANPLAKALSQSAEDPQIKHFLGLTEAGAPTLMRRAEAEKILEAVKVAKKEYVTALTSWLTEVLSTRELNEVVFCGGTADYLRTELDNHFRAIPVKWHGGIKLPESLRDLGLGNRLADVYGLSKVLFASAQVKGK